MITTTIEYYHNKRKIMWATTTGPKPIIPRIGETVTSAPSRKNPRPQTYGVTHVDHIFNTKEGADNVIRVGLEILENNWRNKLFP